MNKESFEHVLRALSEMIGDSGIFEGRIILFGSQAIQVHLDPDHFQEMPELFVSFEVDVAADTLDSEQQILVAEFINKNIGENSHFHNTHGAYADGVALETPTFPSRWRERLVPVDIPGPSAGLYFALSVRDIVASKLYAGREKDYMFVQSLMGSRWPELAKVADALGELPDDPKTRKAQRVWQERYLPLLDKPATMPKVSKP